MYIYIYIYVYIYIYIYTHFKKVRAAEIFAEGIKFDKQTGWGGGGFSELHDETVHCSVWEHT